MAKVIKKKKIRILPFFLLILILAAIFFTVEIVLDSKIKNIIVEGNEIISDQQIIRQAGIEDYPSFYKNISSSLEKKIEEIPWIKKVKVKKEFYRVVVIEVEEHKALFEKETNGKYVLENKEEITTDLNLPYSVPKLTNEMPEDQYDRFIKNLQKVDEGVREKISEIKYDPNDYDKDRFLLYMDDGNSVYLTLTKFEMINYYNDVLPQLDGRKGYLYLDSGNNFQIMH